MSERKQEKERPETRAAKTSEPRNWVDRIDNLIWGKCWPDREFGDGPWIDNNTHKKD